MHNLFVLVVNRFVITKIYFIHSAYDMYVYEIFCNTIEIILLEFGFTAFHTIHKDHFNTGIRMLYTSKSCNICDKFKHIGI